MPPNTTGYTKCDCCNECYPKYRCANGIEICTNCGTSASVAYNLKLRMDAQSNISDAQQKRMDSLVKTIDELRYGVGPAYRKSTPHQRIDALEHRLDGLARPDRARMDALEKRLDQMQTHWLNRYAEEIREERYDAWMGGVLADIPTDALRRELDRRHRASQ